jgi:hypothetical protein
VADQDDRPLGHPGPQDDGEVARQLLDRRPRGSATARRPVAALVVEDQADVGAVAVGRGQAGREGAPLEGPGGHRERVAVDEDDRERRVARADLLHRQQDAVVGLHQRGAVGRPRRGAERVVLAQLGFGRSR